MGWLWGSEGASGDPVKDLDPSLRDFLKKETPVSKPPDASSPPAQRSDAVKQQRLTEATPTPTQPTVTSEASTPAVPPQSLYPDGRYAHLWANYEPLTDIEDRHKTEQDRLSDVVSAFKSRRGHIKRLAKENCAEEIWARADCLTNGSWEKRYLLCREETRAMGRCQDVQTKFLKALGLMAVAPREPAEEERLQIHADRLYRAMLEQEEAVARAKKEGREPPEYPTVLGARSVAEGLRGGLTRPGADGGGAKSQEEWEEEIFQGVKERAKAGFLKRLNETKTAEERAIEAGEIQAEINHVKESSVHASQFYKEEQQARHARAAQGQENFGDRIKRWAGWE